MFLPSRKSDEECDPPNNQVYSVRCPVGNDYPTSKSNLVANTDWGVLAIWEKLSVGAGGAADRRVAIWESLAHAAKPRRL